MTAKTGYLRAIEKKRGEKLAAKKKDYLRHLKKIKIMLLKEGFNFDRLYLYGSLTDISKFHFNSDIDLAIEGLPPDDFLRVYALLLKNTEYPVDLKPFEELNKQSRARIKNGGIVLYDKKQQIFSQSGKRNIGRVG